MKIAGFLYNGTDSSRERVTLVYQQDGMLSIAQPSPANHTASAELEAVPESQAYPIADVVFSPRIGNTPRFLNFADGARFESSDNDGIDQLLKLASDLGIIKAAPLSGLAHVMESRLRYVLLSAVLMIIGSIAFVKYGVPALSKEIAMVLPADVSRQIGQGGLDILDKSVMSPSQLSDDRQHRLSQVFNSMVDELSDPELTSSLNLVFRNSEALGANAFALPSGTIIFTDDIINLADNEAQLQTIMLHEIGHIAYRHSLRQLIQQSSLAILVVLVTGDISTTSQLILALPSVLLQAGYSQQMELEADRYARDHLAQFQLSAADFIGIMEKLEASHRDQEAQQDNAEERGVLDYFSSHPATQERLKHFREHSHRH